MISYFMHSGIPNSKKISVLKALLGHIKGPLRLFLDYLNLSPNYKLQKCEYLSEFLSHSEILNFFEDTIINQIFWDRPHWPIGRPNWPKSAIFDENIKNHEKDDLKISCHRIVESGGIFPKNILQKPLTLLFVLRKKFSKKVDQLQKYSFFTKFDRFLIILHAFIFR